ncbi:MAG TPA: prephenate dehydrogenase [Mycobacteriales bacterium]|nr:prephenate dehydrogenase [Mycobacteriales bacterium]
MNAAPRGRLLVIGTGLIGTSIALAARAAGYDVALDDSDEEQLALAESVGAGRRRAAGERFDLAVAAVPPGAVGVVVDRLLRESTVPVVTHTASVQLEPQREVEAHQPGCDRYVGSHPIAGRERSGPHHASADLFEQRPWVICPTAHSSGAAVAAVTDLALACGAVVTQMSADEHDAVLARLSHVPQLLASALAASLLGLDRAEVALAGAGLRDTSRLADSDAGMWAGIAAANPAGIAAALRGVLDPLERLVEVLEQRPDATEPAVRELVEAGRRGRAMLTGKHGQAAVRWASVAVVVPDEPGALARLFSDAADAGVNVEDIRVDHSPGLPVGIVELDVSAQHHEVLASALTRQGWTATASPPASGG